MIRHFIKSRNAQKTICGLRTKSAEYTTLYMIAVLDDFMGCKRCKAILTGPRKDDHGRVYRDIARELGLLND